MKVANRERQVPGNTSRLFHHYVQYLKPLSHRMSSPSLRSIRSLDWGRQLGKPGPTHSSIYTFKTLGDSWSFGLIEPTSGDLDRQTWVKVRENAKRWAYSCLMFASCSCLFLHNIYDSPINTTSKTIWCVFLACNEPILCLNNPKKNKINLLRPILLRTGFWLIMFGLLILYKKKSCETRSYEILRFISLCER